MDVFLFIIFKVNFMCFEIDRLRYVEIEKKGKSIFLFDIVINKFLVFIMFVDLRMINNLWLLINMFVDWNIKVNILYLEMKKGKINYW